MQYASMEIAQSLLLLIKIYNFRIADFILHVLLNSQHILGHVADSGCYRLTCFTLG